jgi:hypothetical protein
MVQKMLETLTPMFTPCVLNQSQKYWLLFNPISTTMMTVCILMGSTNFVMNAVMQVCGFLFRVKYGFPFV